MLPCVEFCNQSMEITNCLPSSNRPKHAGGEGFRNTKKRPSAECRACHEWQCLCDWRVARMVYFYCCGSHDSCLRLTLPSKAQSVRRIRREDCRDTHPVLHTSPIYPLLSTLKTPQTCTSRIIMLLYGQFLFEKLDFNWKCP